MKTVQKSTAQKPLEFQFRGNAVAAGGFLTKIGGVPQTLDAQTASTHGESCLPLVGGVSRSLIENPQPTYSKHINYGRVETFAEGRHDGDRTVTMLRAEANNIRLITSPSPSDNASEIQSISFVASKLSLQVESIHPRKGQPSFIVKPMQPVDMSLVITYTAGRVTTLPLALEFDDHLLSLGTMDEMDKEFLQNRNFFDECSSRLHRPRKLVYGKSKMPRSPHGYILGSIVRSIRVGGEQVHGHTLSKKGFGSIQFGVMQTGKFSRRVTMARVKMGSDPEGRVGFSAVETNGIWM